MRTRAGYAKGDAKKQEILDLALELVGESGYSKATLREIADRAGLTKNGLLHHFGSKEELFTAVLVRWDELARARYADPSKSIESVLDHVSRFSDAAGLMQLYARLSAEATEASHPAHAYFTSRYATVRQEFHAMFENLNEGGQLRPGLDAQKCANLLMVSLEGLQVQWLVDPSIDISDHIRQLLQTIITDLNLVGASIH